MLSVLHPNGHAFLTWRCHDFRTMASIYMSHLYTRSLRYIVAISKTEILFDLSEDDKAMARKFQKSECRSKHSIWKNQICDYRHRNVSFLYSKKYSSFVQEKKNYIFVSYFINLLIIFIVVFFAIRASTTFNIFIF